MSEALIDCLKIHCTAYDEPVQDGLASESTLDTSSVTKNTTKKGGKRFVMNVVEKDFVIRTMAVLKVPKAWGVVLDELCKQVASSAALRMKPGNRFYQLNTKKF